ncbi:hypothetical protein FRC01_004021 [Tulasnella sp. 417]|nr:hypothetical protein FRC01_004021 [Tulasnella sp. 417]
MQSSSKLTEPPENVIEAISNRLILAVAEANRGRSGLRCPVDPNLSDGMQFPEQISALQLAQAVITRSLDRRIADTKRQWNALRPVNKLPAEVLSTVFHQVLAMVSIFDHYKALFNIAKVSARWQSIVNLTPSLWSYVSSTYPKAKVDLALDKSSPYPLSVACKDEADWLTAASKRRSRRFLQRMKPKDRPWDELTLHLPTIGHLRAILEAPAPHIRKLDIKVPSPARKPINIFGGKRGVLEDVRLTIRFENRSDFTRDTALPSLFRLCNVVSLKLGDRLVGPGWLLRGLSKPNESEGNSEWPFPELAELEIAPSDLLFRDVLDFVRRRYVEKMPEGAPKRPRMLKSLRLVGKEWKEWNEEDSDEEEPWDSDEYNLKDALPGTVYSLERWPSVQKECKINRECTDTSDEESHFGTSSPVRSEATELEDDPNVE